MQALGSERCRECSKPLLDDGDELVCPGCGLVSEKSVLEPGRNPGGRLPLFGRQPLGSFMGTKEMTIEERRSRVSGDSTSYGRMKVMSDHAGREDCSVDCGKLIERVGEKLFLPRVVMMQAATLSMKVLASRSPGRRLTVAEVSAYSLVAACKVEGVTSVSIREILAAFAALGKRVSSSSLFKTALESPVRTFARTPSQYVPRVLAKLTVNGRLSRRLVRDRTPPAVYFEALRRMAGEVLAGCDGSLMAGKRPCALAASAVYSAETLLALQEERPTRITQRECAECGDTAEYTIREQCANVFAPAVSRLASARKPSLPMQTAPRTGPLGR